MDDFEYKGKVRRRKRKQTGDQIVEAPEIGLAELKAGRDVGLLCKNCHKRAPWKDLRAEYELDAGGIFVRIWFHKPCGSMVKEEAI